MSHKLEKAFDAIEAVNAYAERIGIDTDPNYYWDRETVVADLLADLFHYCDVYGICKESVLDRGQNYYEEEQAAARREEREESKQ